MEVERLIVDDEQPFVKVIPHTPLRGGGWGHTTFSLTRESMVKENSWIRTTHFEFLASLLNTTKDPGIRSFIQQSPPNHLEDDHFLNQIGDRCNIPSDQLIEASEDSDEKTPIQFNRWSISPMHNKVII